MYAKQSGSPARGTPEKDVTDTIENDSNEKIQPCNAKTAETDNVTSAEGAELQKKFTILL